MQGKDILLFTKKGRPMLKGQNRGEAETVIKERLGVKKGFSVFQRKTITGKLGTRMQSFSKRR